MDEQEQTIDLRVLLKVLTKHIIFIVVAGILAATVGFLLAKFVVPKSYTSVAMMYVEGSSGKQESESLNINDITVAQKLVNTCQILFKSPDALQSLSDELKEEYTADQLDKMITVESVNNTEVLRITVNAGSEQTAYNICRSVVKISIREFQRIIKGGSIETVSEPTMPTKHTFPSAARFALIGGAVGVILVYGIFLIKELLDIKVKPDDDLAQMYDIPVFAEILDFDLADRGGYKYKKYGKYSNYGSYDSDNRKEEKLYGDGGDEVDDDELDDGEDEAKEVRSRHGEKKK